MNKKLLKTHAGIVTDKFLPDVLKNGEYLNEEKIHIIGLKIKIDDKEIKIIKDRNSKYSDLFVNDKVIINKYGYLYDYPNFLKELKKEIDKLYSAYSEEKRKKLFDKLYISEEEYKVKPRYIIRYEIE